MDPGRINETDVGRVETIFDIIIDTLPRIAEVVLQNSSLDPGSPASKPIVTVPTLSGIENDEDDDTFGNQFGIEDSKYFVLDNKQKEQIFRLFNEFINENISKPKENWMWKELKWLDDFISSVVKIICNSRSMEAPRVNSLIYIISKLLTLIYLYYF